MARIEKTVFISYRRVDRWLAVLIFKDLTQHGYDVFIDYDGIASGDFERAIVDNIRARAHFIVVLTPKALERCDDPADWLRREIEVALEGKRNIVPLLLDGFRFDAPIAVQRLQGSLEALRRYQALEVPVDFFDEAMERLRGKRLAVAVEAVLHPASAHAQQVANEQRDAATIAARLVPAEEIVSSSAMAASQQRARGQRDAVAADEGQADDRGRSGSVAAAVSTAVTSAFVSHRRHIGLLAIALGALGLWALVTSVGEKQKDAPSSVIAGRGAISTDKNPEAAPSLARVPRGDTSADMQQQGAPSSATASPSASSAANKPEAAQSAATAPPSTGGDNKPQGVASLATAPPSTSSAGKTQDRAPSQAAVRSDAPSDAAAQFNLGEDYYNGQHGRTRDLREAAKWYRKAAAQGHADAQTYLGTMYLLGEGGLAENYGEAAKWLRKAAEQGNALAQTFLGEAYQRGGHGLDRIPAEAVKWYRKAAEQGDAAAQLKLGAMYEIGEGMVSDRAQALILYRQAAAQGNDAAKTALKRMGEN